MCLTPISGLTSPIKSKTSFFVYKFGVIENDKLVSPYQHADITPEMEVEDFTFDERGNIFEGIHAYLTIESAERQMKSYYDNCKKPVISFSCILPEDTEYYIGNNGDIVSKKLRFYAPFYDIKVFDHSYIVTLKDDRRLHLSANSEEHVKAILKYYKYSYKDIAKL